jgi:UDP-N-acetyl-D-galactosamine dehydrogenase
LTLEQFKAMYVEAPDDEKVFLDVKGLYSVKQLEESGMRYWRL